MKLVKLEIKERKRDECTENEREENEVYCTRSNQGLSRMGSLGQSLSVDYITPALKATH